MQKWRDHAELHATRALTDRRLRRGQKPARGVTDAGAVSVRGGPRAPRAPVPHPRRPGAAPGAARPSTARCRTSPPRPGSRSPTCPRSSAAARRRRRRCSSPSAGRSDLRLVDLLAESTTDRSPPAEARLGAPPSARAGRAPGRSWSSGPRTSAAGERSGPPAPRRLTPPTPAPRAPRAPSPAPRAHPRSAPSPPTPRAQECRGSERWTRRTPRPSARAAGGGRPAGARAQTGARGRTTPSARP